MEKLNKPDVVKRMAEKNLFDSAINEAALNALVDVIRDVMVQCGTVYIHGLGTFKTKVWKARVWRNPKKGKDCNVPTKIRASFRPTKDLQDI